MRLKIIMTIQEIEQSLLQGISSITNQKESAISPSVPFHDLGIDSLGLIEILVFVEKTFKLPLIAADLSRQDFETIHALASFIHGKIR